MRTQSLLAAKVENDSTWMQPMLQNMYRFFGLNRLDKYKMAALSFVAWTAWIAWKAINLLHLDIVDLQLNIFNADDLIYLN